MPPETCPSCGAEIPLKAKACPSCGADGKTGWSDDAYASSLGIPEENFDYESYVQEEFGGATKPRGISWLWWIAALILVLIITFYFFR